MLKAAALIYQLEMRYARILSIGLVATVAFAWSAGAVEDAHELAAIVKVSSVALRAPVGTSTSHACGKR
jgi:hypothetical protein